MTPDRLREIREDLGLSRTELGQALGLSGATPGHTVRMWETGTRVITGPVARCVRYMEQTRVLYYDRAGEVPLSVIQRDDLRVFAPAGLFDA